MGNAEITDDMLLLYLLSKKTSWTNDERKTYKKLRQKVSWGSKFDYAAFQICQEQGWIEDILECKQEGERKHYSRTLHLTEQGKRQLPIFWRASIYNRRNWWKNKQIWNIPAAILSVLAIIGWLVKGLLWLLSLLE